MKNFAQKLLTGFLIGAMIGTVPGYAASTRTLQADSTDGVYTGQNFIPNGGFESSTKGWTASGGTLTTSTSNVWRGSASGAWTPSASGQTLKSKAFSYTSGNGPAGQNGVLSCRLKVASGTGTYTLGLYDGATAVATPVTITSSTAGFYPTTLNFIFPASATSLQAVLTSVSASEPQVFADECVIGLASGINLSQVSQATLVGTVKITGCASPHSNTSTTFASLGTQTGCVYTTTGSAQAPSTNLMAIRFPSLGAGEYVIEYEGTLEQTTSSKSARFQFTDGTNTARESSTFFPGTAGTVDIPGVKQTFTYTAPASNVTWELFANTDSAGTVKAYGTTGTPGVIRVYRFPTTSDTAVSMNQQLLPTVQKFTSGSGTYTKPNGVSYIRVRMVGGGGGGAGSNTGAGTGGTGGTTTFGSSLLTATGGGGGLSGNNGAAVGTATVNSPAVAVAAFSGASGIPGFGAVSVPGGMGGVSPLGGAGQGGVATGSGQPALSNTGSGGGGAGGSGSYNGGGGGSSGGYIEALILSPSSTYPYAVGAAGSAGAGTNAGGVGGSGYIEVTEYYGAFNAPLVIGSVTSNTSWQLRTEQAYITNGGTAAISRQTGTWISSVSRSSAGVVVVNFVAGMFTGAPICNVTPVVGSTTVLSLDADATTSAVTIDAKDSGVLTDHGFNINCAGPR